MPSPNQPQRRGPRRVAVRLSADVMCRGQQYTTRTRNLSTGGVCLESVHDLPEGADLEISLFLVHEDVEDATSPPLQLHGKVSWSAPGDDGQPATAGVQFAALEAAQAAELKRFLELVAT